MPSKKELQEQIWKIHSKMNVLQESLTMKKNKSEDVVLYDNLNAPIMLKDARLLHTRQVGISDSLEHTINLPELRKQFLALIDYLKLEYKVEDKHLEGFKKK